MLERPRGEADVADLAGEHPAEVLAVEQPRDLALGVLGDVEALVVEEPDDHRLRVVVHQPDGDATDAGGTPHDEARHGHRRDLEVLDVDAGGVEAGHHRPLQHARRPARVARGDDARPLLEHRSVGHGDLGGELGRDVDIGQASHAVAAEQAPGPAGLPHDRRVDHRARLDGLERVHLDLGSEVGVLADEALVADDHALVGAGPLAEVARPADHRSPQPHGLAEVGVVVHHGALELGLAADPDVGAQHRVLPDPGAGLDAAVVADDGRAVDDGLGVDLGALAQPHPVGQLEAGHVDLDLAVEDVLVGPHVGIEGAHVLPVALGHCAVQGEVAGQQLREHLAREVHRAVGLDVVEDLGLEHEDPGVDGVAEHLAPRRLLEEPFDAPVLVGDHDPELERVLDVDQPDGGHGLAGGVELDDGAQVDVGEDVAGDDQEALVELVHGVADRSGRAEGRLLGGVGDPHAELGAVAEVGADGVGHEGDGDDDVVESVALEELDYVLHHRAVGQGHHRFGLVRRQRAQTGALAPSHDHGLHGPNLPRRRNGSLRAAGRAARPSRRARNPMGTYRTAA